jgi:hypothetical protein
MKKRGGVTIWLRAMRPCSHPNPSLSPRRTNGASLLRSVRTTKSIPAPGASTFHPTRSGSRRKRWRPFDPPQQGLSIAATFNFLAHASRPHGAIDNRAWEEVKTDCVS